MAITHVQAAGSNGLTNTGTLAFGSPIVTGNIAFAAIGYTDNGVYPTAVQDNLNNTFTLVDRFVGNGQGIDLWIGLGLIGGSSTVSMTWSGGKANIGLGILEYTPTAGKVFALDQKDNLSTGANVTSFPHGTITTTVASELILTIGRINQTITASAGYTARVNVSGSNSVKVTDRIVSGTETTSPILTSGVATTYAGGVYSFSEVDDTSGLRITQQGIEILETEPPPSVRITQMSMEVLYPYTCDIGPVRVSPSVSSPTVTEDTIWQLHRFDIKPRSEERA